tara:strand:- start:185 stop:559 length:375 start_codon:yes stop_codon:yes gene_type:complete
MKNSEKNFGFLFFLIFLIIGLWPLLNSGYIREWSIVLSLIFLLFAIFKPNVLYPLNKIWIKFGEILGLIIAPIIMCFIYFIILTPISLLIRVFGKDLLNLKFSKKINSYWTKRIKDVGPMKKQF